MLQPALFDTRQARNDCPRQVKTVSYQAAKRLVEQEHYSGTCPKLIYAFGLWEYGELKGVVGFNDGAGKYTLSSVSPFKGLELIRLAIRRDAMPNAASYLIRAAIKQLPSDYRYLISYADKAHGHVGYVYQAAGFYYCGTMPPETMYWLDGKLINGRTLNSRYGTRSKEELSKLLGDRFRWQPGQVKYRYILPLGSHRQQKEFWQFCRYQPKKRYPKLGGGSVKRDTPAVPGRKAGGSSLTPLQVAVEVVP